MARRRTIYIIDVGGNKRYIGSTLNYESRISLHACYLRAGSHENALLQKAYNKTCQFSASVLGYCYSLKGEYAWMRRIGTESLYNLRPQHMFRHNEAAALIAKRELRSL